ncbi:DUF6881 domain-containing protein [Ralstonia solanacearum]|uniref:DUF6881 domain-containing protein n=1 Tax=Ralstonia solanacearum TaxID=305 RepID=UPI00168A6CC8|nr:hypothetical protein [Ralstonia solanacearum]QNT25482.1 hypothetical protein C2I38_25850 [Ralstonia solanacearum]QNT25916.1 hypothetical protein C2I38_027865 [Ralstonia solanacearum]QNT63127.1 hypothetical protein C2L97_25875 [Ralstonia solanacearum]QNT63509.1 hypothetical protein C2L97_27815 [Ralstonia solanacearum]
MIYLRVKWMHEFKSEPVYIYSEMNSDRWETRKVEIYVDRRMGFSDGTNSVGGSMLSTEPLPSLQEIATDPQFVPVEISQEEFEKIWTTALLDQRG